MTCPFVTYSQKKAGRILALISVALLAVLAVLTVLYLDARFPDAERVNEVAFANLDGASALVAGVLVMLAVILYLAFGRPIPPETEAASWQQILQDEPHPAVFGRLCRWNRANSTDLAATILRLLRKGVLRVELDTRTDARGTKASDYLLSRAQMPAASLHPVDDAALKMIFDIIGRGGDSVWLGEIHSFGRHHADAFSQAMRTWQTTLSREVKRSGLFNRTSEAAHLALLGLAATGALAGLLAALGAQSLIPALCGGVAGAASWLAARQMPQHTPAGANAYAAAKALRAHLRGKGTGTNADAAAVAGAAGNGAATDTPRSPSPESPFAPELIEYAYVLRELGAACDSHPGLAGFCDELTTCIGSTAFAAESTVAYQSLRALNSPVRGATLHHAGVTGLANPEEDTDNLFARRA